MKTELDQIRVQWDGEYLRPHPQDLFSNASKRSASLPPSWRSHTMQNPRMQKETVAQFLARGGRITSVEAPKNLDPSDVPPMKTRGVFSDQWASTRSLSGALIQGDKARVLLSVRACPEGGDLFSVAARVPSLDLEKVKGWLHNLVREGEVDCVGGVYTPRLKR